jgi:hypothetical protein
LLRSRAISRLRILGDRHHVLTSIIPVEHIPHNCPLPEYAAFSRIEKIT